MIGRHTEDFLRFYGDTSDLFKSVDELIGSIQSDVEQKKKMPKQEKMCEAHTPRLSIYVSHPFSGNEDKNRQSAEILVGMLSKEFPDIAFFNPLNAMQHLAAIKTSYADCMNQCLYWLRKCDGLIMARGWEHSKGCTIERQEAMANLIPVWDKTFDFPDMSKIANIKERIA